MRGAVFLSILVLSVASVEGYSGGGMGGGPGGSGGRAQPTPFQTTPTPTTTTPSSTKTTPSSTTTAPLPKHTEVPPTPMYNIYEAPGEASLQGSAWVGNFNLYNLSSRLGLYIEIVAPPGFSLIGEESIVRLAMPILSSGRLMIVNETYKGTPLPFLHLLIMIQPMEKAFAVYCAGRLFEQVQNDRVYLKPGILWQAITWEQQEMVISPPDQLQVQIDQTLATILKGFVDLYKSQNQGH